MHRFEGDRKHYDDPQNSMLDVVLERRRGLPILLSVVYIEAARRAGIALSGVGLPGHFVVGYFGAGEPLLLDPFDGGSPISVSGAPDALRPWLPDEIAMRMLNNLVSSYTRRGHLAHAIRAGRASRAAPCARAAARDRSRPSCARFRCGSTDLSRGPSPGGRREVAQAVDAGQKKYSPPRTVTTRESGPAKNGGPPGMVILRMPSVLRTDDGVLVVADAERVAVAEPL